MSPYGFLERSCSSLHCYMNAAVDGVTVLIFEPCYPERKGVTDSRDSPTCPKDMISSNIHYRLY